MIWWLQLISEKQTNKLHRSAEVAFSLSLFPGRIASWNVGFYSNKEASSSK